MRNGFTLIELILAMTTASLVMAAAYVGMSAAFDLRERSEQRVSEMERAAAAFDRLAADLEAAPAPTGILAGLFSGEDATGENGESWDVLTFRTTTGRITMEDSGGSGGGMGGSTSLVRGGVGESSRWWGSDMQEVSYTIEPAERGQGYELVRRVRRNLLVEEATEGDREVLCRDVAAFEVRYDDGTSLVTAWDSSQQGDSAPAAVLVTIMIDRENGDEPALSSNKERATFVRLMRIPAGSAGAEQQSVQLR